MTEKNANYERLVRDIHERRRVVGIPKGQYNNIEDYLSDIIQQPCSMAFAELGTIELFPYEERTLSALLEREGILKKEASIESLRQYTCPCCQTMTEVDLIVSGSPFSVRISYLPSEEKKDYSPFVGRNITLQGLLEFPGIDKKAKLEPRKE